jgi:pyridoxamine 5'-phosphate oxidase
MSSFDGDGGQSDDPLLWFNASLSRARELENFDATRAALATVSSTGQPSVRYVLVKRVDDTGFVFFTNHDSRKARELHDNPRAALAFHWASIGEQVRVEGSVERVSEIESDEYFERRPRGSQLAAWTSTQSAPVASRAELEDKYAQITERFRTQSRVPRPAFWGGYRIAPTLIEFWRDRQDRLHDRIAFTRDGVQWRRARLQP